MTKTYAQQKRAFILPALLTFSLGLGLLLLKTASYAFMRSTERTAIAGAASAFVKTPFGHPYLVTAFAKDPDLYARQCAPPLESAIVRTSTWMLIHGPTVEVCLTKGPDGRAPAGTNFLARLK